MKVNWQPIETAPMDGTWILAIIEGDHPVHREPYTPIVVKWDSNSWSDEIVNEYGEQNLSNWSPTHWMPLPEPPNKLRP